ncbi:NO-inducible flavohemoprotein [Thiomicrorhabdus sp.]|uniref:NO-inducible flavohemoprotein n=1 Tax=Thiomicrorhabdus sp. TaxID=2039724 RepID=UPI0029C9AB26|nr:NO-inducible flavohemoprotein [Thiomicrorhabdus sp.]
MLSPQTISTVKSTVPLLEENGLEITSVFYKLLFEENPQLQNIFNQANQHDTSQSRSLADAVLAYASNIDNLEVLLPAVARIANKHASIGIQADHYPLVGASLLAAIQQVLDLPAEHPALKAWGEAYGVLADIFINTESELYDASNRVDGGWKGYRPFVIKEVRQETPDVKSLRLEPKDGKAVKSFSGGQYVSVKIPAQDNGRDAIRQYSLSDWGDDYRITVKRETKGEVSPSVHTLSRGDELLLSPPFGEFTLNADADAHVFISGGVGITPLFSMLKQAIASGGSSEQLQFIECCRGAEHQIFKEELTELSKNSLVQLKQAFEYGSGGDFSGRLTRDVLNEWLTNKSAHVYFCGPLPFMKELKSLLNSIGMEDEQLHYEVFGPTTEL